MSDPKDIQVGGDHYKRHTIQPIDVMQEYLSDEAYEGFLYGNIIKYAQRFGKKDGKNEKDLYKVIHYAIILLGAMHEEELKELNDYHLELKDGS